MKIIDEKGRLFGKINVIDFLAFLLLFCIIPIFYSGYRIYTKKTVVEASKVSIEVELPCKLIVPNTETLKLVTLGDKEVDAQNNVIGEITWLGDVKPYRRAFDLGSGLKIVKEDPVSRAVFAKLKLKAELRNDNLFYKDKMILANLPIEFKTAKYTVQAVPDIISNENLVEKWIQVKVRFNNLIPEVANILAEADTENGPDGTMAAKITKILSKKNAEILILKDDRWLSTQHPVNIDIVALLKVLCLKEKGILYYNNSPVRIGSPFTFSTELYSITGIIIGID